jgi:hypothetical protein
MTVLNFHRQQLLENLGVEQLPAMTLMAGSSTPAEDTEVSIATISVLLSLLCPPAHLSNTLQRPSEVEHQQPDQEFHNNGIPIRTLTVSCCFLPFVGNCCLTHGLVGGPQMSRLWQQR